MGFFVRYETLTDTGFVERVLGCLLFGGGPIFALDFRVGWVFG